MIFRHSKHIFSPRFSGKAATKGSLLIHALTTLLLLILFGSSTAFAQDYSGTYYIASTGYNANNTQSNYYLCPTEEWCYYDYTDQDDFTGSDNGKPFLTTHKCRDGNYSVNEKAVWIVEKHPTQDYYYIKRAYDNKYIVFSGQIRTTTDANRMRVHIETLANPDDKALFAFESNGDAVNIKPKTAQTYLTVNGGNDNALTGVSGKTGGPTGYTNTKGIIGIYATKDANSNFYLEKATVDAPIITNNYTVANTFTITAESGATIYYTTDNTTPTTSTTTTGTTTVNITMTDDMTVIKAIAKGAGDYFASAVTTYDIPKCEKPVMTVSNGYVTITCGTEGATIHYTTNDDPATTSSATYTEPFARGNAPSIRAIATKAGYINSNEAVILPPKEVSSSSQITDMGGNYILTPNFTLSGSIGTDANPFTGTIDGELVAHTFSYPLVAYAEDATIKNVILENINISGGANVGAICNVARGACRIYNCGVLGTSTISGSGNVGSIVGLLDGTSRVINCYSFASVSGGTMAAGIVGNNNQTSTQNDLKTIVVNCMFYGDITGSNISPVYGGTLIDNAGETGINNYNYYRRNRYDRETDTYVDDVTFDDNNFSLDDYHRSWPADAKYLTRFEYYRSILNSNKKLCTWWVNGTNGTAPTDEDIEEVGIAKWVLDPSIAPYPILKKWEKYPSVINQDPARRFNPSTNTWEDRADASANWGENMAPDTQGQILGTVSVTINGGTHHAGPNSNSYSKNIPITAMDTENNDYCYGKIQLPYYNEIFGDPEGESWNAKYGGNYTAHVVTGWDIAGGSAATDYNFADRNSYSGRVYAQGGYFYVPEGVTSITITAHWADAVYLCNKEYSIDRVNVASGEKKENSQRGVPEFGSSFAPAGTIPNIFQGRTVYTTIKEAIGALSKTSGGKDVYNQAIVLIGNVQVRNHSSIYGQTGNNTRPFTLMSADLDFDNEPDNCLELQFRNDIDRPGVQPIRFDFLPVPELGLAIRTNKLSYAIGIMIPLGHFEITETAFMHTTQFEYDGDVVRTGKSPVIINGGEHEMFTKRKQRGDATQRDRTSYFLLGGNAWVHRFAPGAHPNTGDNPDIYLFPVNVIGGQVKELYLTGLYRPELPITTGDKQSTIGGTPRCYIDGGKFDIVAGAGYDKVSTGEDVTFKINHSLIGEFYGGGINGSNPISGNIDVTINNSKVDKYCGGPKVGDMTGKTITTHATGTTFGVFYGGGNGGDSYYRELQRDGDFGSSNIGNWEKTPNNSSPHYNYNKFNPLNLFTSGNTTPAVYDANSTTNKGYHAEYEFEVFSQSNGLSDEITQRGFIHWIQFGITTTGDVESTLNDCRVLGNFYGGGNLASVNGNVTSTLTDTQVDGNAFGAGYSAAIPLFQVHDKDNKSFPSMDDAGTITAGNIPYDSRVFEWTNNLDGEAGHDAAYMKAHPTYQKDGKWYCYTWNSLENLGVVTGNVTLNIEGNTLVLGNMTGGVFGGGDASGVDGGTQVNINATGQKSGYTYNTHYVYGGGNKADVAGSIEVNIIKGIIANDVYGGGALANTNIGNINNDQTISTDRFVTEVNLHPDAKIHGDVYGGGRGQKENEDEGIEPVEATVYGNISVYQLGAILVPQYTADSLATAGRIFGCNNANGSPMGHVYVYVSTTTKNSVSDKYAISAVYGGGNEASFIPFLNTQNESETTEVVIDGCANVTIHSVYGGGNAASTPATNVKILGAKEIKYVYGGGNGAGMIDGKPNPGANVGYKAYPESVAGPDQIDERAEYIYGSGKAVTEVSGGTIQYVYGGSNTKGNVRNSTVAQLEELGNCPLVIGEIYGGGREAYMEGKANIELGCITGMEEIYGGSEKADVGGSVELTITSGTFNRVFGGNNKGGRIYGSITVNIEQTGCLPIVIGELYLGGNNAPYSVYGYQETSHKVDLDGEEITHYDLKEEGDKYPDPVLNIRSFKSIGTVFGGGNGALATMVGDPTVDINLTHGWVNGQYTSPSPYKGAPQMLTEDGVIETVFGGGNEAIVIGSTKILIGDKLNSQVSLRSMEKLNDVLDADPDHTITNHGITITQTANGVTYTNETDAEKTLTVTNSQTVIGAKISGNVYGGGNEADVTNSTNIQIGPEQ